jgi:hypothetical protein
VKLARFRRLKAICFLSYVEYRPNTYIAILQKIGHTKGRSHMRGERAKKKEVKKVNILDVLSIQE